MDTANPKPGISGHVGDPYSGTTFTDGQRRTVRMRTCERYPSDFDALVEMYAGFGAADRAQGIPPRGRAEIRSWLDRLDGLHVVATHGETPVGHAVLAPYDDEAAELAIFVRPTYQGAKIGTGMLGELLARGADAGLAEVRLHVERSNEAAIALYRKYGFEVTRTRAIELEMRRPLDGTETTA